MVTATAPLKSTVEPSALPEASALKVSLALAVMLMSPLAPALAVLMVAFGPIVEDAELVLWAMATAAPRANPLPVSPRLSPVWDAVWELSAFSALPV